MALQEAPKATLHPFTAHLTDEQTAPESRNTLVIIPTFVRGDREVELLERTLESVCRTTDPETTDILVVDDGSPETDWADGLEARHNYRVSVRLLERNLGFSATVNSGLKDALKHGSDAVLVNADIDIITDQWIPVMQGTVSQKDGLAGIVGAMLIYPDSGTLQHAGIYFSRLHKAFLHRYMHCDPALPAANRAADCPVTGALQYIRWETLDAIGLYDDLNFRMGFEDVEFCLRALRNDIPCVYQPKVKAWHHESAIRGKKTGHIAEWEHDSRRALVEACMDLDIERLVDGQ